MGVWEIIMNKKISKLFTEIGIDPDNNKFLIGVSSEIEYEDGSEIRQPGLVKMKLNNIYIRVWVFNKMLLIASNDFEIRIKNRNNFKIVIGWGGYPLD
jgi:hypothetical protein